MKNSLLDSHNRALRNKTTSVTLNSRRDRRILAGKCKMNSLWELDTYRGIKKSIDRKEL